jgi:hypothetical protein
MKESNYSLAVFAYNRPDHLKNCLASLELNHGIDLIDLHIFIDGSKGTEGDSLHESVLRVATDFCSRHDRSSISAAPKNLGLRNSVITALTSLFAKYDGIIVVEDDLILSSDFIDFMHQTLSCFAADESIGSVSGFAEANFPFFVSTDLIAAKRQSCWGWATWKDRWGAISWDVPELESAEYLQAKKLLGSIGWDLAQIFKAQVSGSISSWAITFDLHAARNGWKSLQPRHTLVVNSGMDGSGTHFTEKSINPIASIAGRQAVNVNIAKYTTSRTYDLMLKLTHSKISNLVAKILSYIRLRISQ